MTVGRRAMWAQIIKGRVKPGGEGALAELRQDVKGRLGQRPGLMQAFWMQDQHHPQENYTILIFESEAAARATEPDVSQNPTFQRVQEYADGAPEYVDLEVIDSFP
jgi:hypothetical protein